MAATAAAGAAYTTASLTLSAVSVTAAAIVMPYYLLRSFEYVDPIWTLACERADAAGELLAETLLERRHGTRPVTLLGFSMGARLLFACLQALGRRHRAWADACRSKGAAAASDARQRVAAAFYANVRAKNAAAEAAAANGNGNGSSSSSSSSSSGGKSSGGGGFFSNFSRPSGSVGSGSGKDDPPPPPLTPLERQELNEAARAAAEAAANAVGAEESPVAGLIGDVVLMGAPVSVRCLRVLLLCFHTCAIAAAVTWSYT
jgi:hypothetical protein